MVHMASASPGQIIGSVLTTLIVVYVAFLFTGSFCQTTPSYCVYGWGLFSALVIGATYFLKVTLFGN